VSVPAARTFSALWWLQVLEGRLRRRQTAMLEMDDYYTGNHPFPFLTRAHNAKMRDEFQRLLSESQANFMELVVDATEERLHVDGFRVSAERNETADEKAWAIWQANQMDAQSKTAIVESLVKGVSYLSVWEPRKRGEAASIAVEDPLQTIVAYEPGSNYMRRSAALKIWLDEETGTRRANVYLPGAIYKFAAKSGDADPSREATREQKTRTEWDLIPSGAVVKNTLGIVPIIPLRNRPRLLSEGSSDLRSVYRIQNQINGFLFLLALGGYFGAHKQRWAAGVPLMQDNKGNPVEPWDIAVDTIVHSENPNAKFGEFTATDLNGYIKAIEQKVDHIAALSRVPRHFLVQQGQSPSGDALKSAESGLVKKVEGKQRILGEAFEEAISLARRFMGERDVPVDSEIVWVDAREEADAVQTDAVVKQYQSRLIPRAVALAKLGYTQTQIRRILATPGEEFAPEQQAPPAADPAADPPAAA